MRSKWAIVALLGAWCVAPAWAQEATEGSEGAVVEAPMDAGVAGAAAAERLRALIAEQRERALAGIRERLQASQTERMTTVADILGWFSLTGLLLLFAPLFLRRRHPGRQCQLFKFSAVAAFTFVGAVVLFTLVLVLVREIQSQLAFATNPQIAVTEAVFEVLHEYAEGLAALGPALIEPTLAQLAAGGGDSLAIALVDNAGRLGEHARAFETVAGWLRGLDWLFAYVPVALTLATVVLFLASIRPVLMDIVQLPARAAAGGDVTVRGAVGTVARQVGRELLATLALLGVLVAVMSLSGALLGLVVRPATEAFLGYFFAGLVYVQLPDMSTGVLYLSLGATVVFLVLNIAAVLASGFLYLSKSQRLFRLRFHERTPLRAHGRFWKWGTASLVWAQALPFVFILVAQPAVEALITSQTAGGDVRWGLLMSSGPLILVAGYLLVYWLARGLEALGFLARYSAATEAPATPPVAQGATAGP